MESSAITAGNELHRRLDWLLPAWLEDASAYDQNSEEDMISVYYTVAINVVIFTLCFLFFSIYRRHNINLYSPKKALLPNQTPPVLTTNSYFGWVSELWAIDDEVVIDKGGFDTLFLLRFYRLAFKIFICFALYGWGVLVPINVTATKTISDVTSYQLYSMTNIQQGSPRCWFHLIGMFLLTGIGIYFLEQEMVVYAKYRHIFLRQRHAHLRTVLVEGIPDRLRSTVTLATYLETLYPNSIHSVNLGQDLRVLDRLVQRRLEVVSELERCLYINHYTHVRPLISVGNMLQQVDAIRHYTAMLDELNRAVLREQEISWRLANHEDRESGANAFDVIESFLEVTEMGAVKKFLKAKTGSAEKWMKKSKKLKKISKESVTPSGAGLEKRKLITSRTYSSKENLGIIDENAPIVVAQEVEADTTPGDDADYADDFLISPPSASSVGMKSAIPFSNLTHDSEQFGSYQQAITLPPLQDPSRTANKYGSNGYQTIVDPSDRDVHGKEDRPRILEIYETTWGEWFDRIFQAESFSDCWRAIKYGGVVEKHDGSNEERVALISPPEQRKRFLSKAFVTFKTFTAATIARQVVHMQLANHMAISEAPAPTDISWMNMYATRTGLFWRRVFVETMVLLLIIVWVAPVTLLSYVVSEDALRSFFPWVDYLCDKSAWISSIVSLAQPGALMAIMNLLPPILSGLAVLEGCISYSANQFKSFDRYFTFQVINVFLVTTIAGSVLDVLKEIYLSPSSTYILLGASLPKMGAYFLNYMIIKSCVGLGMEIMRLTAMLSALCKYLISPNLTMRDRKLTPLFGGLRHLLNPGSLPYAKIYAQDTLQVVICFTFACIAPLTLIGGLCYFGGASFIYKHQMLYIYEPAFETGGRWWPKIALCIVVAMLFAQITLVGMMVLKEVYVEAYILGGLVAITSFYYYHVLSAYVPLAAHLPFDMAASMDLDEDKFTDELAGAELYIQPSLRAGPMAPECEFSFDLKLDAVKKESANV